MAGPSVRISSALPDSERDNGLGIIHDRALIAPQDEVFAVVRFRVDKIVRDVRSGSSVVMLRIRHIEAIEGDATVAAHELLDDALEDRLGIARLPFDEPEPDGAA